MFKYDIDIKSVILDAWTQREMKGNEWRLNGKSVDLKDRFLESLNRHQKEMFIEIQEHDDKLIVENENNLVEFVLAFIKSFYKWNFLLFWFILW